MRERLHHLLPALAGGAALTVGFLASALWSSEAVRSSVESISELETIGLEPVRALPRTDDFLAMVEARANLADGRPWNAWRVLREHVAEPAEAPPALALLAAEAAAGWGAWEEVERVLDGRGWLDGEDDGAGWLLLGRALEELQRPGEAVRAYQRQVRLANGRERGVGYARLGRLLGARGEWSPAAGAYARAAGDLTPIRDWTRAFQAEALAQAGDAAVERVEISSSASPPARKRVALARVAALVGAGDTAAAVQRAERETRALASTGARSAAAAVAVERARLLAAVGQFSEARVLFRSVAAGERVSPAVRAEAARGFEQAVGRRTAREELARADAFRAAEDAESAAEALAAALRSGLADKGSLHFRLGQFYFEAREYNRAREAFAEAERRLRGRALASEAALFAARSLFRDGHPRDGQAGLERVAREYPGTAAAGSAYFLLGDATNSVSRAIGYYRRAAGVPASSYAHEALYRLGDRLEREGNPGGAIQAWSDYARRYPRGEHASQAAYRAGVLQEGRGEGDAARDLYTAAIRADPVSYYALRAGYRTGEDPLAVPLGPSEPWVTLASDAEDAETVLERLALLEEIGAGAAWQEEYETALAAFDARPYALLELAAGLVEQEHVRLAIGLGWDLLDKREGKWDRRLLEVIFPFPWRSIFEREAGRYGVEATLLAGLVRQESLFQPAISSWVGASGLAQIMPGTGSWLAPKVGLDDYEHRLLTVPEVSLRIGAYFLGSLLGRYDGARDLALAGYNAGPGRADRWRRTLGYGQGTDRFRESIPFDETRDYVKNVLLNAAVYQRLYGDGRPSGLVED